MYRFNLDIAVGTNQGDAITLSKQIINHLSRQNTAEQNIKLYSLKEFLETLDPNLKIQVRVTNDEDRKVHNYLLINENGHAASKKLLL